MHNLQSCVDLQNEELKSATRLLYEGKAASCLSLRVCFKNIGESDSMVITKGNSLERRMVECKLPNHRMVGRRSDSRVSDSKSDSMQNGCQQGNKSYDFNVDLSLWDVSHVTTYKQMFQDAK